MSPPPPPAEALARAVSMVDLSPLRAKLLVDPEDPPVSPEELTLLEAEYHRFLALHLLHPEADLVPSRLLDRLWRGHLADAAAYRDASRALFGHLLDRRPASHSDHAALQRAYALTLARYRVAFGPPPELAWPATCAEVFATAA